MVIEDIGFVDDGSELPVGCIVAVVDGVVTVVGGSAVVVNGVFVEVLDAGNVAEV